MRIFAPLRSVISALFHRSLVENEIEEELRAHIQDRANDLERSGVPRAEAERRARLEFGGYEKYKEEIREAQGTHFLVFLVSAQPEDRKSTRLNSSHANISYAVFCL